MCAYFSPRSVFLIVLWLACVWVCLWVMDLTKKKLIDRRFSPFFLQFCFNCLKWTGKLGRKEEEEDGDIYFNNIWINQKTVRSQSKQPHTGDFHISTISKTLVINTLLVTINIIDNLLSHNAIQTHTYRTNGVIKDRLNNAFNLSLNTFCHIKFTFIVYSVLFNIMDESIDFFLLCFINSCLFSILTIPKCTNLATQQVHFTEIV